MLAKPSRTGVRVRIIGVDAFTSEAFHGNPAMVCVLDDPGLLGDLDRFGGGEPWLRHVATELNQPVTAFVCPDQASAIQAPAVLRWFSPSTELPLCGHGTLAAAHVLFEEGHVVHDRTAEFRTVAGPVTARHDGELVWLSLPAGHVEPAEPPAGLVDALGVAPVWFGRNEQELVVELASPAQVRDLRPDIAALGAYPVTRVVVTSWDGDEADIVSRVFAPSIGVPEDQVTGSAHATLGPLWALRSGRSRLTAYQASSRGGELDLVMRGERVEIGGRAVTTNRGDVLV